MVARLSGNPLHANLRLRKRRDVVCPEDNNVPTMRLARQIGHPFHHDMVAHRNRRTHPFRGHGKWLNQSEDAKHKQYANDEGRNKRQADNKLIVPVRPTARLGQRRWRCWVHSRVVLTAGERFVWLKTPSSFRKILLVGHCLRHLPGAVEVQPFHRPQSQHRFVADANGIHIGKKLRLVQNEGPAF